MAIIKDEGTKSEAVNLEPLVKKWGPEGERTNIEEGMKYSDFIPEVKGKLRATALEIIILNWVDRLRGRDSRVSVYSTKKSSQ